jgi:hypothetical protein
MPNVKNIYRGTELDQILGERALPTVRAAWVCEIMQRRLDADLAAEFYCTEMAVNRELGMVRQ